MSLFEAKTKEDVRKYITDTNINAFNKRGMTALMVASEKGLFEVAQELLELGADPNITTRFGTALFYACKEGKIDIIDILLNHNADVNILTEHNWFALRFTCLYSQFDAMMRLLNNPTLNVINQIDSEGNTPFLLACNNTIDFVDNLICYGADYRFINKRGSGGLHFSCNKKKNVMILKELLKDY